MTTTAGCARSPAATLRLSAHAPRSPLGDPYGRVACDRPCAAGGPNRTSAEPPDRVPLALPGSWVFLLGDGAPAGEPAATTHGTAADAPGPTTTGEDRISGELVVFLAAGPVQEQLELVEDSLRDRLSIVANDLSALSHEEPR